MNRSELVDIVGRKTSIDPTVVEEVLQTTLNVITVTVSSGEDVQMRGFGKFCASDRGPTTLKNPRNGEPLLVDPRRTISFRPSTGLKRRLNDDLPL